MDGELRGKRLLVTGAASGIGRAVALELAARGVRLYLTDRNADGLMHTAELVEAADGTVVLAEALDVTDRDAVVALAARVHEQLTSLDGVLNVAGIAIWGTVSTMSHEQWRQVIEVNLMGPIHVIEAFVPPMITGGRGGHLVNVASAAGLFGLPWHAAYSASKFGLRGLSEVLRFELAPHGVHVSLVCPGGVDTGLTETIQIAGVNQHSAAFTRAQRRFRSRAVSAESAARSIVRGMERERYLVYTSPDIRVVHAVQRYVPPAYDLLMRGATRLANRVAAKAGPA